MTTAVAVLVAFVILFFFNDAATTEIYTLSLHDALPISAAAVPAPVRPEAPGDLAAAPAEPHDSPAPGGRRAHPLTPRDRKSTRLNSSHANISYAVFCLKKNKGHDIGRSGLYRMTGLSTC